MVLCLKCASLFGDTTKGGIGMWMDRCYVCEQQAWVADASYDFGISAGHLSEIVAFVSRSRQRAKERGWRML